MKTLFTATAVSVAVAAFACPLAQAGPLYNYRVLVDNLSNPRGLLVQGSRLLVSEAGAGGVALPDGSNCITSGAGTTLCSGETGAIGAWDFGTQTYSRLISNLPSLAQSSGVEGTGIADLASGGPTGLLGVFGFGGAPSANTPPLPGSNLFARVVTIDLGNQTLQPRADLGAYEAANNPDQGDIASNPYSLSVFAGKLYVTDSGANTLLTLNLSPDPTSGDFAIEGNFPFPPTPASSVPTGLAVNPVTSQLLIGEFSGFPFTPGSAKIYASNGSGSPSVLLDHFTTISDLAVADDGSIYVLEYAANLLDRSSTGSVWRVDAGGNRLRIIEGLIAPTGLALGPEGALFVTSSSNGLQGELREYRPVPGPLPLFGAAIAWDQARRLRRRTQR